MSKDALRGTNPLTGKPWPTAELVMITPQMAGDWMDDKNFSNRTISQSRVDEFVDINNNGDWEITPDAVGFDEEGNVTNGQHRLMAIFLSGKPAPMFVNYGLTQASRLVTDQGKKRSFDEQISLSEGINITKLHVAIARAMSGGLEGRGAKHVPKTITDTKRFIGRHYDAIVSTDKLIPTNVRGISSASVRAVLARAYYTVEENTLVNFSHILCHGTNVSGELNADETAPIVLRETLIRMTGGSRNMVFAREIYARTERALTAFIDGRPLKHRVEPVTDEQFLLPEEQEAKKARIKAEQRKPKAKGWQKAAKPVKAVKLIKAKDRVG